MTVSESPLLDDDAMVILNAGYLLRPATRAALRSCLERKVARFDETVEALVAAGFIRREGDRLSYESPYATFVALGRARAERMSQESERTAHLIRALPDLVRAWDLSEGRRPVAGTLIHADPDTWEEWIRYVEAEIPVRPSLMFAEPDALEVALRSGHPQRLQRRVTDDSGVRVLLPGPDGWSDQLRVLVEDAVELGVQFRASHGATTWMYVDEGAMVGLPAVWRTGTPSAALAIRTRPVVSGFALLFDELWSRAVPIAARAERWEPILYLLARGATDDAIARTLGLATRTVRRRIADAMVAFEASSRFMLGAAWQARQDAGLSG